MRIAVLGTGHIGRTLGAGLIGAGHDVFSAPATPAGLRTFLRPSPATSGPSPAATSSSALSRRRTRSRRSLDCANRSPTGC
jgi:3-hydroxyisobutyrate dehydrogenase-like beta-hydroxyacid dehydrogenase